MAQLKCRTCFEVAAHYYPLTDPYESADRTLADLLLDITKIDTSVKSGERLPKHICGTCSRKLKTAYSFVQQAHRVNDHLLKLLRDEVAAGPSKDCLLEAPIDIPAASSGFQIKMEAADIGEESVYDAFSGMQMPVAVECDVAVTSDEMAGSSNKNKAKVGVALKKEDMDTSNSLTAHPSLDPITVSSTRWYNDSDDDDNDDNDESYNMMEQNNDTDSPFMEDRKCLPPTSASEAASTKKRKIFTIEVKSAIISRLQSGSSNKKLAKEFGVSHSTISTIWRNRKLIQKSIESESPHRKRIRPPQNSDIEQKLLRWLHEATQQQGGRDLTITGRLLQTQANEIAKQLGKKFNTISDSWIYRFRMRNNIALTTARNGVGGSANNEDFRKPFRICG